MLPCKKPLPSSEPSNCSTAFVTVLNIWYLRLSNINTWKSLFSSLCINCKWLFPSLSNLSIKIGNRYFPRCQWIILQGDLQAEGRGYCGLWQLANYARQVGFIFFVLVLGKVSKKSGYFTFLFYFLWIFLVSFYLRLWFYVFWNGFYTRKVIFIQLQEFPTPPYCCCCSVTKRSDSGIAEA